MPIEQYSNLASTGLSGMILAGAAELVVEPSTLYGLVPGAFPNVPHFTVRIDNEFLRVTAMSGHIWQVSRGVENSTADAHASGSILYQIATRESLKRVGGHINLRDESRNRPAAGTPGRVNYPTTGFTVAFDTGNGWASHGPQFPFTAPVCGDFQWVQGPQNTSGGVLDHGHALVLYDGIRGTTAITRILKRPAPVTGTPITAFILHPLMHFRGNYRMGLCFRQNGGGENGQLVLFGIECSSQVVRVENWVTPTSKNANVVNGSITFAGTINWFRLLDDGVNHNFYISGDGRHWFRVLQVSRTNFLTQPNEVGFYIDSANAAGSNSDLAITLLHWDQTSLT